MFCDDVYPVSTAVVTVACVAVQFRRLLSLVCCYISSFCCRSRCIYICV